VPAMTVIASIGFLACLAAFCLGFVPPEGFAQGAPGWAYPLLVGLVVIALGVPPLIFYALRKPKWDQRTAEEKATFDDVLVNPSTSSTTATATDAAGRPPTTTG